MFQKKKTKRLRIDSSESEPEPSSPDTKSLRDTSPEPIKTSPKEEKPTIKLEKTGSPKTYASPKSKVSRKETSKNTTPKNKKTPKDKSSNDKKSPVSTSLASQGAEREVVSHGSFTEDVKANIKMENDVENLEVVPGKLDFSRITYPASICGYHRIL